MVLLIIHHVKSHMSEIGHTFMETLPTPTPTPTPTPCAVCPLTGGGAM